MSHFLRANELSGKTTLGKSRAAVIVMLSGPRSAPVLKIQSGISIAKPDTQLAHLPDFARVVDGEGKEVRPSPGAVFMVSTETIDPFHLIVQVGP